MAIFAQTREYTVATLKVLLPEGTDREEGRDGLTENIGYVLCV